MRCEGEKPKFLVSVTMHTTDVHLFRIDVPHIAHTSLYSGLETLQFQETPRCARMTSDIVLVQRALVGTGSSVPLGSDTRTICDLL